MTTRWRARVKQHQLRRIKVALRRTKEMPEHTRQDLQVTEKDPEGKELKSLQSIKRQNGK